MCERYGLGLLYIHKPVTIKDLLERKMKRKIVGLQVHCPANTPKDGPSTGGAICIAYLVIYQKYQLNQMLPHW